MLVLLFSSSHSFSTGFRSEDWNGHRKAWFCAQWPIFCVAFEVWVWIIVRFEDPNMAHYKISKSESVNCWFFYLLVFDRIHDAMGLNNMSRTFSRNIGPTTSKIQQYISLYTWGTFYPCVQQTHLRCLLLKSFFICLFHLTIEASPIWSPSRIW